MELLRLPGLRVFRQPGFRALLAVLLSAIVGVRLAALLPAAFANMQDYREVFIPSAQGAWHGLAVYRQIPLATGAEFNIGRLGAIDTPVFLFLVWPLTVLPDIPGRVAWETLQVVALLAIPLVVYRGLGRPTRTEALFALALLGLFPSIKDSLDEGQISIFLGLAVAATTLAHQRGRPVLGGVVLGLAGAVKLTPFLLVPYFAWRRDWKLCGAAAATSLALFAATLAVSWARLWPPFLGAARQLSAGTAFAQNQSINGVLMRLLAPARLGVPVASPGIGFQALQTVLQVIGVVLLAWLVARTRLPEPERLWTQVAVILLVLPLVQPFAWFHHFAWAALAIPVGVHLASRRLLTPRAATIAASAFTAAFLFTPALFHATTSAGAGLGSQPLLQAGSSLFAACAAAAALALALGARPPAEAAGGAAAP